MWWRGGLPQSTTNRQYLPGVFQADGRLSLPYITEECLRKLDTKQQTNTLLSLVWRDSASEEAFTLMACICHTLLVQQRMMVPRVRHVPVARRPVPRLRFALHPYWGGGCFPVGQGTGPLLPVHFMENRSRVSFRTSGRCWGPSLASEL